MKYNGEIKSTYTKIKGDARQDIVQTEYNAK